MRPGSVEPHPVAPPVGSAAAAATGAKRAAGSVTRTGGTYGCDPGKPRQERHLRELQQLQQPWCEPQGMLQGVTHFPAIWGGNGWPEFVKFRASIRCESL